MTIEASIVEQLQELRKWQIKQQEELMKQQQEQRDMLSNEQSRMYQALSLSMDEINFSNQSLKELLENGKQKQHDLIDFNSSDNEYSSISPPSSNFSQYVTTMNEGNNKIKYLKTFKMELPMKHCNTNFKVNLDSSTCHQLNYNLQFSADSMNSFSCNQQDCSSELSSEDRKTVSSRKSQKLQIPLDELPVPSPKKDFNTLLEERLKDCENISVENKKRPVVKKPFLKKGQGLARFNPNLNSDNKIIKNTPRPRSASFSMGTQSNTNQKLLKSKKLERCNSMPKSRKNDNSKKSINNAAPVAQSKLILKNVPLPKKKLCSKSAACIPNATAVQTKRPMEILSDQNSSDLEFKTKRELEEVRIFELLEDKAENSSFCSTSSTVIAFLQQSTPLKHKALLHSASKHKNYLNDIGDETLEQIVKTTKSNKLQYEESYKNSNVLKISEWDSLPVTKLKNNNTEPGIILPFGTDVDEDYDDYNSDKKSNQDENNVSLHVRFSEHNEYKTMTDTSSISSDSQTVVSYFNDKGAWSDCSVTPDSSDVESLIMLETNTKSKFIKNESISEIENNQNARNTNNLEEQEKHKSEEDSEDENESGTETVNVTLQKSETTIDEQNESISIFKSELLKTRLLELEKEIEIFRKESAALILQRQKLQEERTKLQEERLSMQRDMKEKQELLEIEKRKTENILQEEKKRLAREKTALESRMKDAWEKAQKNKQERLEHQTLKNELEEIKEELSQKESKWSASNARQRSQMRVLQTENSKLKQELEKFQQKKNFKLKKPVSNTRAIHQISKFLADRKKISPFKNDDLYDELKVPDTVDTNYVDTEVIEENVTEQKIEKVKILKTAESIARTRNLYESLLRDATECFTSPLVEKNSVINKQSEIQGDERFNEEEDSNYDNVTIAEKKGKMYSAESKSPKVLHEEMKKCDMVQSKTENHTYINNNKQGIREVHHNDGHIEYWYPNGNVKKVFPEKYLTKMIYYNGDVRETDKHGTVKYFYAATRTWHTTMPDGLEILEFPDGQTERRTKDGTVEVSFPDGSVRIVQVDGSEKWALQDGTIVETLIDGEKILTLPNGQREIHTKDHKRREYPDGTVKLIYPDGVQETRYANGRIRQKDKYGNLIMDTQQ